MPQVVVDGLITAYSEVGKGKNVILMLHGWADTSQTFETLAKELTAKSKKYKIILLDLPGFGGTQTPPADWSLGNYASFVADFLAKVEARLDVIIGHSNGGAIAVKGLATRKLAAQKLILIASAGVRRPSLKKTLLRLAAKPVGLAIKVLPKTTQKRIRQRVYGAIGSDYLIAEHMQETFKRVVSEDVTAEAAKIDLPVCLIYGAQDKSTPPLYGQLLAKAMPDSRLEIIPMTGHFVHKEQVYQVSDIIKAFLK
jgi:pimeloyl-ACP methyl ester carboxylesterase